MAQLFLFEETREDKLIKEVERLRNQCEKVRKGQYAKLGELTKMYNEIKHELDQFKMTLCQKV